MKQYKELSESKENREKEAAVEVLGKATLGQHAMTRYTLKYDYTGHRRKGGEESFEKAQRGFHWNSKHRNLFGEDTVRNEEGFEKRADSTVVSYCELELVTSPIKNSGLSI